MPAPTISQTLAAAARTLPGDTARLDAELLLAHLFGVQRGTLLLDYRDRSIDDAAYEVLLARRRAGEPVAYIIGTREFWSLPLAVSPSVLIPRADSETLIERACHLFAPGLAPRILDLGTGSGALLLAALTQWPRAWGLGVDRSSAALAVARANAAALGIPPRAAFVHGDWGTALAGGWDLVLANPPYVAIDASLATQVRDHEPSDALFAGVDGLDAYRALIPDLPRLLAPHGVALVEIGHDQARPVGQIARAHRLDFEVAPDLAGRDRALVLRRIPN